MKYNSKTAAAKAFKEAVNNEIVERCELGTIGVQVYNLVEGSEYEVITEFGKDERGRYYIQSRSRERFGIKSLNAVDFENLVTRWEEVQTEAADAAEEFAQHGAVKVEAERHACGYTCTWLQFVDACEALRDINENKGIYEELGVIASNASIDLINGECTRVMTEKARQEAEYLEEVRTTANRYGVSLPTVETFRKAMYMTEDAIESTYKVEDLREVLELATRVKYDEETAPKLRVLAGALSRFLNRIIRRADNKTTADRFGVSLEVVECLRDIETLTEEEAAEKYPADLLRQAEELGERETTEEDTDPDFNRYRPTPRPRVIDSVIYEANGERVTLNKYEDGTIRYEEQVRTLPMTAPEWENLCHVFRDILKCDKSQQGAQ